MDFDDTDEDLFTRSFSVAGKSLTMNEDWEAGLGGTMWEGGHILSAYMQTNDFNDGYWKDKKVIELGAGCGLPGLTAAVLGSNVYLTDMEISVPLLQRNYDTNKDVIEGHVECKPLFWGKDDLAVFSPPLDVVLAADVVYKTEAVPHLIATMRDLSGPDTTILLSFFPRVPEATKLFWELLPLVFSIDRVDDSVVKEILGGSLGSGCGVFKLKVKPDAKEVDLLLLSKEPVAAAEEHS